MRKAWALFSALLVMLASLVPSLAPVFHAPVAARAQSGAAAVVTIREAGTEAFPRGIAHPLYRAAGVDPALVRITLVQARPINAFATSGNRMFINTGPIPPPECVAEPAGVPARRRPAPRAEQAPPPDPLELRARDLREAARRDTLRREQRQQDHAMRRRQPR